VLSGRNRRSDFITPGLRRCTLGPTTDVDRSSTHPEVTTTSLSFLFASRLVSSAVIQGLTSGSDVYTGRVYCVPTLTEEFCHRYHIMSVTNFVNKICDVRHHAHTAYIRGRFMACFVRWRRALLFDIAVGRTEVALEGADTDTERRHQNNTEQQTMHLMIHTRDIIS